MRALFALPMALLLCACAGQTPPLRYYTLDLGPSQPQSQSRASPGAPLLSVGPVTLPETIDRPELVMRSGPNRVQLLENDRWAEPLKLQLGRALAARLAEELPHLKVMFYRGNAAGGARWRLALDVQRFESEPGKSVMIEAAWTLHPARPGERDKARESGNNTVRAGRSVIVEPVTVAGTDAVVAAHDRALARLAARLKNDLAAEWLTDEPQAAGPLP